MVLVTKLSQAVGRTVKILKEKLTHARSTRGRSQLVITLLAVGSSVKKGISTLLLESERS